MASKAQSDLKIDLRREARSHLKSALNKDSKAQSDAKIIDHIAQVLPAKGGLVALFRGLNDEPDLMPLLNRAKGYEFAFPRVEGDRLQFYKFTGSPEWETGAFQVQEPKTDSAQAVELDRCQAVCVPGLLFDQKGGRLGRGKGYYDRALEGISALKIGVAYAAQMSAAEVPCEDHDIRMDVVVTENSIFVVKG